MLYYGCWLVLGCLNQDICLQLCFDYLKRNTTILDTLRDTNVLDDATAAELEKVTDAFILEFQGGKGQAINKPGHEEVAAAHEEDVNQEQIVKGRRG